MLQTLKQVSMDMVNPTDKNELEVSTRSSSEKKESDRDEQIAEL